MKISEKSNGRILETRLKFPSSHSGKKNRLLNFTPAFFRRFKDLEPMLLVKPVFHLVRKETVNTRLTKWWIAVKN